jgi:hypothetical protein
MEKWHSNKVFAMNETHIACLDFEAIRSKPTV